MLSPTHTTRVGCADVVTWRDFGLSFLAHFVHPVALLGRIDNRVEQNHGIGYGTDIPMIGFMIPLSLDTATLSLVFLQKRGEFFDHLRVLIRHILGFTGVTLKVI